MSRLVVVVLYDVVYRAVGEVNIVWVTGLPVVDETLRVIILWKDSAMLCWVFDLEPKP